MEAAERLMIRFDQDIGDLDSQLIAYDSTYADILVQMDSTILSKMAAKRTKIEVSLSKI